MTTALAVLLLTAGAARGQGAGDGGPAVVTPKAELEWLHLGDISAALELEWRLDLDEVDPPSGAARRNEDERLREILDLRTTGFIGHPNLVELDLRGRVWLEQHWLDLSGRPTESTDQTLYEWDVSALILRNSETPLTLYTRQNISDVNRDFGGTLANTFQESGARLSLRDETFPTTVQVFRREIRQEDRALGTDFTIDRDTVQADGRVTFGADQRLAWDIQYDDIDESGDLRTPRSVERIEGNLTHTLEFGEEQQNVLRTRARIYDETGDRELRQVRIDPRLRLRHTDHLYSWYDYSYARDDRPDQDQRSHRATANVQYDLFESVTAIGTAGYEYFEIPAQRFDSQQAFGRADIEYRKKVPYGRLLAGLDVTFDREERSELGTPVAIPDQLFTFSAADLIVSETRNVVEGSVMVTDATGTIVYTEGIDYIVRTFPDRIEIQRLVGGNIVPGQSVLVEFVMGPEPGGTTDTLGLGVDARYTLEEGALRGLSWYVQYRHQDENRDVRSEDFLENDFDELRYGTEYNRGALFLLAERQERTGSLSPFVATRLEGRLVEPLGLGSNVVLSGIYQEIDRDFEDLRTTTSTITGQWNQRVDDDLRLSLIARYRWSNDNRGFDSEAFEQQFDLSWRRGRTEVYTQIRNSMRNTNADDRTVQRFIVGIRRVF